MGMFDYVRYAGPVPLGHQAVPQTTLDALYQTKNLGLNLDVYEIDEQRCLVLKSADDLAELGWQTEQESRESTTYTDYTGFLELIGGKHATFLVARVANGVVGPFYLCWDDLRAAEAERNRLNRKGRRKRYRPKPKTKYVSKAEQKRLREQSLRQLGEVMASSLYSSANCKGFVQRFLNRTE